MTAARKRDRLSLVLGRAGELVTVENAAAALNIDRSSAAKTLARWHEQGWLKRLQRGLYAPVALTASPSDQVIEHLWTLVPALFDPAYIGGASAAHHWDLTEQLFRTVFVYSAKSVRRNRQTINDVAFSVHHIDSSRFFGTRPFWQGRIKVDVSDVHRTLIDMLDLPERGGGIRHVADCFKAYLQRNDADVNRLIDYAVRLDNGAIFKRLGFLAEILDAPAPIAEACSQRLTKGNTKLDPSQACPRLVRRWRLWIPTAWKAPS